MDQLKAMKLRGVRSFSPNEACVIEFYKPLTIIVGPNGSGKTTLIEALKYACTGELPPNSSSGQAFLYDPKLAGETEVKAQIILQFQMLNQDSYTIYRIMTLTQQKSKQTFKALDAVLKHKDHTTGEVQQISKKCADLDKEIPEIIHVSKAILENVIFCHQEDSNWPLDQASVVKKKFDDIFASTRYTKALENIKSYRKEQTADMKVKKERLVFLSSNKTRAKNLREEAKATQADIDAKKAEIVVIEEEQKQVKEEMKTQNNLITQIRDKRQDLEGLQRQMESMKERRDFLQNAIVIDTGSGSDNDYNQMTDDEIRKQMEMVKKEASQTAEVIAKMEKKKADIESSIAKLTRDNEARITSKGSLMHELDSHKSKLKDRRALVTQLAEKHKIKFAGAKSNNDGNKSKKNKKNKKDDDDNFAIDLDDDDEDDDDEDEDDDKNKNDDVNEGEEEANINAFTTRLSDVVAETKKQLDQLTSKAEADVSNVSASWQDAKLKTSVLANSISLKQKEIERVTKELAEQERALSNIRAMSEEEIGVLEREIASERQSCETMKNKLNSAEFVSKKENIKSTIAALNKKLEDLRNEERDLQATTEKQALLAFKETEATRKEDAEHKLHEQVATSCENLKSSLKKAGIPEGNITFSTDVASDKLKIYVEQKLKLVKEALANAKQQHAKERDAMTTLDSRLESVLQDFNKKLKDLKSYQEKLGDDNPDDAPFPGRLAKAEADFQDKVEKKNANASFGDLFNKLLAKGTDKKCCPLCERSLEEEEQLKTFEEVVKKRLAQFPEKQARITAAVEAAKAEKERLQKLQSVYDGFIRVEKEIESMKKSQTELSQNRDRAKENYAAAKKLEEDLQSLVDSIIAVRDSVDKLVALSKEVKDLRVELTRMQANRDKQAKDNISSSASSISGTGTGYVKERTRAEVISEETTKKQELEAAKNEEESLREAEKKQRDKLHEKELAIQKLEQQARDAKAQNEKKQSVEKTVGGLKSKLRTMKEEKQQEEDQLPQMEKESKDLERKKEKLKQDSDTEIKTKQQVYQTIRSSLAQLQSATKEIAAFKEKRKDEELANVEKMLKSVRADIEAKQKEVKKIVNEMTVVKDAGKNKDAALMNLENIITLRDQINEIAKCEGHEKTLTAELNSLGNEKKLVQAISELQKKLDGKNTGKAKLVGQIEEKTAALAKLNMQLKDKELKNAEDEHNKEFVQMFTMETALADLDKFYKALDSALMEFHKLKMAEINKHIKELWQKTYHGADIDTIEIRADAEAGTTSRSSYNYRVVMVRGDHVLNMRGRCSAGQKVLACLIIRLALADAFCNLNCGVMTLDEPTTNLDEGNVKGLATCLQALIDTRKKQKNFQLIIITHDEAFVEQLASSQLCDHYFRVSKNADGYSTIGKAPIRSY